MNALSRLFAGPVAVFAGLCWMPLSGGAAPGDGEEAKPLVAEWSISPRELSPDATVEVVFPTSMIEKERVGDYAEESPLVTKPALSGEFQWTSTRSGQFHVREAPKFNASYEFSLRDGVVDLEGQALSTDRLGSANSASFRAIDRHPRWYYSSQSRRKPRFMFEFNDQVDPKKAAQHIRFASEEPVSEIPARVRHATADDFEAFRCEPQPTWAEVVTGVNPTLAPGAPRMSALVIEPATLLTVAENWRLIMDATLENASGRDSLAAGDSIHLGDIKPFEVRAISAHTPFDSSYYLDVVFNSRLTPMSSGEELTDEDLAAIANRIAGSIAIEPQPEGGVVSELNGRGVRLTGNFELNRPYRVIVEPGVEAGNGLKLETPVEQEVTFVPNPPYLAAEAFIRSQLAVGSGDFNVTAANVESVRCRVKTLRGPELLQAVEIYGDYQSAFYRRHRDKEPFVPVAFGDYPGEEIHDQIFRISKPLDKSERIRLNWRELLGDRRAGALFVEMEGKAMKGLEHRGVVTQTLVQLTDLGLMQKSNGRETLVFVSSLSTGEPVPGVRVTMVEGERQLLGYGETNAEGIARISGDNPDFILAEKDGDSAVLQASHGQSDISWVVPYDIPRAWDDVWQPQRRTFVFTDRPLYRPGETLHLKAHSRLLSGDAWSLDAVARSGRLVVRDPRYRKVIEREIEFSSAGSMDADIPMPEGPLGWYELSLEIDSEEEDEEPEYAGSISVRVDEFKANTFEVMLDGQEARFERDRVVQPLSASYYMGKALSKAQVMWSASASVDFEAPPGYQAYHFGGAPSWSNYAMDRDAERSDDPDMPLEDWFVTGETHLGEDGKVEFELPMPPEDRAALPRKVSVWAEVTDINQQTISGSTEIELPGAEFLLGLRGPEYFGRAGEETRLEVIAVTDEGVGAAASPEVKVTIERQEYHTLKVATAGGGTTTKEQVILREALQQTASLVAGANGAPVLAIAFTPERSGTYFVTAETTDSKGTAILSRMPLYVVGGNEFPWAVEDGSRILLQPEKTDLKPGEEAVIVVKTPIAGTALVTVERNRVHRHFLQKVSPEEPLVRVPVEEGDAPNVFVSVVVVRGAADSPQSVKMPVYKVGYCELSVESDANDLRVVVDSARDEVLPGEELEVSAKVMGAGGEPVPGAEVTLFAVDEGVLSLMSHETPDPEDTFGQPFPLAMDNLTSFEDLLTEDQKQRSRGNKGFLIGGGGEGGMSDAPPTRTNFVTTPLWVGSAMTDAAGSVSASVKAPDGLTRYRLMAVAAHGVNRFGSGEGSFEVNKPLMIEPVAPRFARVGDELLVKAVVHNTTRHSGTVEVTLEVDEEASIIRENRFFIPASLLKGNTKDEGNLRSIVTRLDAGETTSVAFPVRAEEVGTTSWRWQVVTREWPEHAAAVSDATETHFEVRHPVPELREVRYARLQVGEPIENMLAEISPVVLEGEGSLQVSVSNTQLFEARDALDYVLRYPYGCVEQTTSATLPWLALGGYESVFPELLGKGVAKDAIQKGVNRLLRMTTSDGGLAYWPGGDEASFWGSAYGGLLLLKARDAGADVPDSVVDRLLSFLSKRLRGLEDQSDPYVNSDAALALYTLARGGRAEPAYQNLLHARRGTLPEITRLQAALAMCLTDTPAGQIKEMLGWKPRAESAEPEGDETADTRRRRFGSWAGTRGNDAMRLIAYVHLGLTEDADELAQRMLLQRNGRGDWGNTFANAWNLTAMVAYERSLRRESDGLKTKLAWGSDQRTMALNGISSALTAFDLSGVKAATPLSLENVSGGVGFVRVEALACPPFREFEPVNKGYQIERSYQKLMPDGTLGELAGARVGDMIAVQLDIETQGGDRYLVIDDPLPSVFEAINSNFDTQNSRDADQLPEGLQTWFCDHRELRDDRALFFTDYAPEKGRFRLQYLARVIAEGDTIAPPARIEAMYEPDRHGLSATQRIRTLPSAGGVDVASE